MSRQSPQPTELLDQSFTADNSGYIDVQFEEVTPKGGPVSKGSLGYGMQGNQSTRTYLVYFTDTEEFVRQACGYPIRWSDATLGRRLPIRDPQKPWLVATRASDITPYGAMLGQVETPFGPYAEYEYSHVTILFEAVDYDVIDDPTLWAVFGGDESRRFTNAHWEYGGEFLTRQVGCFKFAEGDAGAAAGGNNTFPQPKGMYEAHARFVIRWFQLPETGIMNAAKLLNMNILNGKGSINHFDWPVPEAQGGFAAGTLLCEDIKVTPSMAPVEPALLGLSGWSPPRVYDLDFVIDWFDPPLGTGATTRGHNAFPWAKDNRYYLAKSADGSNPLYDTYDFSQMFVIT
jgi:hypothetical protein